MARLHIGKNDAFSDLDERYKKCEVCGCNCEPELIATSGSGVRVLWICPKDGIHSIVDPFEPERDLDF